MTPAPHRRSFEALLDEVDRAASAELGLRCQSRFGRAEEKETGGGVCRVEKLPSGRFAYFVDGQRLQGLDGLPRPVLDGLFDAQLHLRDFDLLTVSLGDQRFRIRLYPLDPGRRQHYGVLAGRDVSLPPSGEPGGAPTSGLFEEHLKTYLSILARQGPRLAEILDRLNRHMPPVLEQLEMVTEARFTDGEGLVFRDVKVLPTLNCNQRCLFCCARASRRPFPTARLEAALADLGNSPERSRTRLSFSGGEPTLHPDLPRLLGLGRQMGFASLSLQTNGVLLARADLMRALSGVGLAQVIFSLHSHRSDTYDHLTGTRKQLPRALEGLRRVLEQPFKSVLVNIVINRRNVDELADYADFIASLPHHPSTHLAVMPSTVFMESDNGHWAELFLPHTEAAAALREAAARHERLFVPLQGDCFLPFCIGAGYPELSGLRPTLRAGSPTTYLDRCDPGEVPPGQRIKHRDCRDCALDSRCGGVCGEYARRAGLGELNPLAEVGEFAPFEDPWIRPIG